MSSKIRGIIQLVLGVLLIFAALWYLTTQFSSIKKKLNQVVSKDIPNIKNRLEKSSKSTEKMESDIDTLTGNIASWGDDKNSIEIIKTKIDILNKKINDELIPGRKKGEQNVEAIKILAQKIDKLSKQYVRFLKLAEDKIVVSIPPKWVDERPHRKGTIFAIGIGLKNNKLTTAQERAGEQARSNMAMMLRSKTLDAVRHTIKSAGKPPPSSFKELSPGFKQQINGAVDELLLDSEVESYWVDPNGHVYALISLPLGKYLEGSKLGTLIDTLKLTKQSITEALIDSTTYPKIAKDTREETWNFETTIPQDTQAIKDESGGEEERETLQTPEHSQNIDKEIIHKFILEWKHEWESKDFEKYMQRYSRVFNSKGMNWNQWSAFKKGLAARYHQIALVLKDIQITFDNKYAMVNFKQLYRSDDYSDCGMKSLLLGKENGKWKIFSEKWEPLPGNLCADPFNREM